MPQESISEHFVNRDTSPIYEINPKLLGPFYNWNTKELMKG
jgi:hypothetical protein